MDEYIVKYINIIHNNWKSPVGLATTLILVGIGLIKVLPSNSDVYFVGAVWMLSFAVVIFSWFNSKRLKKIKKNHFGFIVSIYCDPPALNTRMHEDFIITLEKMVSQGHLGKSLDFRVLPPDIARQIQTHEDATALKAKLGGHFVVYGRVRQRNVKGQDHNIVNLDGVVGHGDIETTLQKSLSKEFGELWPKHVRAKEEDDLFLFEFTSEWVECVATYIIAIAALYSGVVDFAQVLLHGVIGKLESLPKDFPVYQKLSERVPIRLFEAKTYRLGILYAQWRSSRDPSILDLVKAELDSVPAEFQEDHRILTNKAILAIVGAHDSRTAIMYLSQIPVRDRDTVWHCNMAFLFAYGKNLMGSYQQYLSAEKGTLDDHRMNEIEEFIRWAMESEEDLWRLYFCLGCFLWKMKGDFEGAKEYFALYINDSKDNENQKVKDMVSGWLKEL